MTRPTTPPAAELASLARAANEIRGELYESALTEGNLGKLAGIVASLAEILAEQLPAPRPVGPLPTPTPHCAGTYNTEHGVARCTRKPHITGDWMDDTRHMAPVAVDGVDRLWVWREGETGQLLTLSGERAAGQRPTDTEPSDERIDEPTCHVCEEASRRYCSRHRDPAPTAAMRDAAKAEYDRWLAGVDDMDQSEINVWNHVIWAAFDAFLATSDHPEAEATRARREADALRAALAAAGAAEPASDEAQRVELSDGLALCAACYDGDCDECGDNGVDERPAWCDCAEPAHSSAARSGEQR